MFADPLWRQNSIQQNKILHAVHIVVNFDGLGKILKLYSYLNLNTSETCRKASHNKKQKF